MLGFCLIFSLAGCGNGTKQDIMKKAENAKTKAELQSALGKPDNVDAAGAMGMTMETWTYKGSDGDVVFTITNDKVQMKMTGGGK